MSKGGQRGVLGVAGEVVTRVHGVREQHVGVQKVRGLAVDRVPGVVLEVLGAVLHVARVVVFRVAER